MAFGDVFAGYEGAAADHWKNVLQMDYQNKRAIAENYAKIADDPRYDEETQQEAQHRSLHTLTFGPGDKLPKEYENFTFTRKPPVPAPVQMPGAAGQGAPIPSQLPGPGAGPVPELGQVGTATSLESLRGTPPPTQPTAGVTPQTQTVQPPTPPPHTATMAPMPFSQQLERQRAHTVATTKPQAPVKEMEYLAEPDANGDVYKVANWRQLETTPNPTGDPNAPFVWNWNRYSQKSQTPVRPFAPRFANAASIDVADALDAVQKGVPLLFQKMPDAAQLAKLQQAMPGATLKPTGMGQYYVAPPGYKQHVAGNNVYLMPDVASMEGQAYGENAPIYNLGPNKTPSTTTYPQIRGVDASGRLDVETATRETTPSTAPIPPGGLGPAAAPTAPPQPGAQAQPGAVPAPSPIPQSKNVPRGTTPVPTPPPVGTARGRQPGGLALGAQERGQQIMLAVAPAAQILYGDPKNPDFESLASFAKMADDPEAAGRIGTAARFIIERLNKVNADSGPPGVNLLIGSSLTKGLMNKFGLTEMLAGSEADSMQNAIAPLHDDEARYLARIMAAYGTVVGLRRFTGGGAYEFSTTAMERELPIPGLTGVKNSMTVYAKLAQLGEEISSATKRLDPSLVPEQKFYEDNAKRLTWQSKGWGIARGKDGSYMVQKSPGAPWEKP